MRRDLNDWVAVLYVTAWVRAGFGLLFALYSIQTGQSEEFGSLAVTGRLILLDVGILTALGFAAYRGQLWSAYALIVYSTLDSSTKFAAGAVGAGFGSLVWVGLFCIGTLSLFREKKFTNSVRLDIPFVVRTAVALLAVGVLFGGLPALFAALLGLSWRPSQSVAAIISAYSITFLLQVLIASRKTQWVLEQLLCAVLLYQAAGLLMELPAGVSLFQFLSQSIYVFALTFVAWAVAQKKPFTVEWLDKSIKWLAGLCGVAGSFVWALWMLRAANAPALTTLQWTIIIGSGPLFFLFPWFLVRAVGWLIPAPPVVPLSGREL